MIGFRIDICGRAPSDFPELAEFLIEMGIQSLSFTPNTIVPFLI